MKRFHSIGAMLLVFFLTHQCISASHIVKRAEGGGFLDTVKNMLGKIPIIGNMLSSLIDRAKAIWEQLQNLTNGAVGRILGGALPCTISLDTYLTCTGVTTQSSLADLVQELLDPIPSLVLPGFAKSLIIMSVKAFVVPLIDAFLGGVPMKQSA